MSIEVQWTSGANKGTHLVNIPIIEGTQNETSIHHLRRVYHDRRRDQQHCGIRRSSASLESPLSVSLFSSIKLYSTPCYTLVLEGR